MIPTRILFAAIISAGLVSTSQADDTNNSTSSRLQVKVYAPPEDSFPSCTQIAFHDETEIVTAGDRLFYRTDPQSPFRESPIQGLSDAHAVVFNPLERVYYATDTGNHQLMTFADPGSPETGQRISSLAGIKLKRPHDLVFDSTTGWTYTLNPDSSVLLRFQNAGQQAESLDLSRHLGYSRALTIVEGRLYVVGSSAGTVVEVVDFAKPEHTIHTSFGKKKDAPAGGWNSTGLVLNDVDFYQGHWYATSYFCPTYADSQNDDENKFIRFKTWHDFETGTWEDLSPLLPTHIVPYYLTPDDESLFIATYSHEAPGTAARVYQLTSSDRAE